MPDTYNTFDDETLCVTLTLEEYRELVRHEAVAGGEIEQLHSRLREAGRTNDELVAQIQALQERLEGADDGEGE